MRSTIILMMVMALAGCGYLSDVLDVKVERQCDKPDKDGYMKCVTSFTDYPICNGSCAKK